MTPSQFLDDVKNEFNVNRRKFATGLAIALGRFLIELNAVNSRFSGFADFAQSFPVQTESARGGRANTLIVKTETGTLSIRPFYNEIELFFRATKNRFDYPNSAPHATQAWSG